MSVVWNKTATRRHSRILDKSLVALRYWLEQEWARRIQSPKLHVVFVSNLETMDRQAATESGKPEDARDNRFPMLGLCALSMQPRTQGPYVGWAAQNFGIKMGSTGKQGRTVFEYVRPVDVGVALRFECTSVDEARAFASIWALATPSVCIDIADKKTNSKIRITFDIDGVTNLPPNTVSADSRPMSVDTTVIVRTYVGENVSISNIQSVVLKMNAAYATESDPGSDDPKDFEHVMDITFEGNNHVTVTFDDGDTPDA